MNSYQEPILETGWMKKTTTKASPGTDLEIVVEPGNLVPRKYLNWQKVFGIFIALCPELITYPFSELTGSMCVEIFCRIRNFLSFFLSK